MIEMNLPVSGTTHYNQLNFNLDAPSPASTLPDHGTPPPFILIQKIPEKPFVTQQLHLPNSIAVSDEMSLAHQLAKLDVSNSLRNKKVLAAKEKQPDESKQPLKVKMQKGTKTFGAKSKIDKKNFRDPAKAPLPVSHNQNTNLKKSVRVHSSPDQLKAVKFIPPKHNDIRYKIPRGMKDAITSTCDLSLLTDCAPSIDNSWTRGRPPQELIKKEKLQKRFNQKTSSNSGFLSHYRSPAKQLPLNFVKQPTIIARCDNCSARVPEKQRANSGRHESSFSSSKNVLPNPSLIQDFIRNQQTPSDFSSHPSDYSESTGLSKFCEFSSSLPRKQCHKKLIRTKLSKQRNKNTRTNATVEPRKKTVLTDSNFDNVKHRQVSSDDAPSDIVEAIRNNSQCENLYQRLVDIENTEKVIRHRWQKIQYEDLKKRCYNRHNADTNSLQNAEEGADKAEYLNIRGGKKIVLTPKKEVVKFMPQKHVHVHQSFNSPVSLRSTSCTKRLSIPEEIVKSIHKNKLDFRKYLNSVFHEPKGKFNPWKIVVDLSEEIMTNVVENVCDKVNEGFDGCVEELFEAEFAQPNQSDLYSTVEQSLASSTAQHNSYIYD